MCASKNFFYGDMLGKKMKKLTVDDDIIGD